MQGILLVMTPGPIWCRALSPAAVWLAADGAVLLITEGV